MKIGFRVAALLLIITLAANCGGGGNTITFEGNSMLPTIRNGQQLQRIPLDTQSRAGLVRGDIVAFGSAAEPSKVYIRRLIALPGETVEIQQGSVVIDRNRLAEPYLDRRFNLTQESWPAITVPPHTYYLLGDNRDGSYDSRRLGVIPEEMVFAKIIIR